MTAIDTGLPVWWEVFPGAAAYAIDTRRRRWFGSQALIFYREIDSLWASRWVPTYSLVERNL